MSEYINFIYPADEEVSTKVEGEKEMQELIQAVLTRY